jgi:Cytochrome P450
MKSAFVEYSGKRSCFGEILARQELFLILTRLVHLFEIRPPEGQSRIDFTRFFGFTIRPLPYSVRLVPRTVSSPATGKVTSDKMLLTITDAN